MNKFHPYNLVINLYQILLQTDDKNDSLRTKVTCTRKNHTILFRNQIIWRLV